MTTYEHPKDLIQRPALGREEFCQRLLTMLVLGGRYPRWNSRSTPTPAGRGFLRQLDALSFGESQCDDAVVFVDELELAPRIETEKGGAPDDGVLGQSRMWMIELKTEAASPRSAQLPLYYEPAAHHFPTRSVDITYLTPTMTAPPPPLAAGQRYTHVTWSQSSRRSGPRGGAT